MERVYVALTNIHHRPQARPQSLAPAPEIIIAAGPFDPATFGVTETELQRMISSGIVVTPEQFEASLAARNAGGQVRVDGIGANIKRVLKPHA